MTGQEEDEARWEKWVDDAAPSRAGGTHSNVRRWVLDAMKHAAGEERQRALAIVQSHIAKLKQGDQSRAILADLAIDILFAPPK
jgi:hypothetical protein